MPEISENSSITISAVNSSRSLIALVTVLYLSRILVDSRLGLRDVAAQLENLGRRVAGCPGDQVEVVIAGGRLAHGIVEVPFLLLILEIA